MLKGPESSYRFNIEQRAELRKLGVIESQLAALEAKLPLCAALLSPSSRLNDVRDELDSLNRAMRLSIRCMSRTLTPGARTTSREILNRLIEVSSDDEGMEFERALHAMEAALQVVEKARKGLPKAQRRSNTGSWQPVALIDQALVSGWGRAHFRIGEVKALKELKEPVDPTYPHPRSTGHQSKFRQIVRICYQVILPNKDRDPERAIKSYVRYRQTLDRQSRKKMASHIKTIVRK